MAVELITPTTDVEELFDLDLTVVPAADRTLVGVWTEGGSTCLSTCPSTCGTCVNTCPWTCTGSTGRPCAC